MQVDYLKTRMLLTAEKSVFVNLNSLLNNGCYKNYLIKTWRPFIPMKVQNKPLNVPQLWCPLNNPIKMIFNQKLIDSSQACVMNYDDDFDAICYFLKFFLHLVPVCFVW